MSHVSDIILQSYPPSTAIFAALAIFLAVRPFDCSLHSYPSNIFIWQSVRDLNSLVHLLESIELSVNRLGIHPEVPKTGVMTEVMMELMVEMLSALALVTKQTREKRLSKSVLFDMPLD